MKVVINRCFGGFGLSDAAYERLIEWGCPVRALTGRWATNPNNEGEVIFDNNLVDDPRSKVGMGRYWDTWTDESRTHPLVVRVVEELGDAANGPVADLAVVEIPDGVEFEISEYDGLESIHEKHRVWK